MNNELVNAQNNTATVLFDQTKAREAFTLANLVFNPAAMQALHTTATTLANSGMVPDHFRGKPDDVMAILMQAGRWGLEPTYIMQSTFVHQGKIGYEAKILQSVAQSMGGIEFDVEYYGAWNKIQGNFTVKTSTKNNKPYNSPNWNVKDEEGVGVRLTGIFPNGKERTIDVALKTCHPRYSTNWANDPETQIHYTAIKRWVRRHAPHLLGGIQDYDDLSALQQQATEREINPIPAQESKASTKAQESVSIDDVLNYQQDAPAPEAAPETTQELKSEVNTSVSIDDVLNSGIQTNEKPDNVDNDGVYTPSVFEQMLDLLNDVKSVEDYPAAKQACLDAFNNGQIESKDLETLGKTMRTLEEALGLRE